MHKCILCGNESFSSMDNVCQRCIDDFIEIDKSTLPEWLFLAEQRRSFDMILSVVKGEVVSFLIPFRILPDEPNI